MIDLIYSIGVMMVFVVLPLAAAALFGKGHGNSAEFNKKQEDLFRFVYLKGMKE